MASHIRQIRPGTDQNDKVTPDDLRQVKLDLAQFKTQHQKEMEIMQKVREKGRFIRWLFTGFFTVFHVILFQVQNEALKEMQKKYAELEERNKQLERKMIHEDKEMFKRLMFKAPDEINGEEEGNLSGWIKV